MGRISAGDLGLDAILLEGVGLEVLRGGPGHYPGTGRPGGGRTVAVAAHRTTYSAPFRDLEQLGHGDRITVSMPTEVRVRVQAH